MAFPSLVILFDDKMLSVRCQRAFVLVAYTNPPIDLCFRGGSDRFLLTGAIALI
ncbi:hypothetical protein [Anabaena azotica]|uniref:hypothetical protein n=1 Tax=Anabaena azotica TaxID=197653 RepID=UPI001681E425|nr:hypothetical protein [Anabaena azotica]